MKAVTALVTGATGFVGSHLVRRLLREGFVVHVLCRSNSNYWRIQDILPHVVRHLATMEDGEPLIDIVAKVRPDYIFHLASATVVAGSAAGAAELVKSNLLGTVNLLNACESIDYRGFINTGDSFEYSSTNKPLCELDACNPDTLHGITKLATTLYGQSIASTYGKPIVTLRLFSTYGPNDNPRRLIPQVISGALANTPILLSRPEILRDWIYVDDLVDLYLESCSKASQLAGGVFNAGSGQHIPLGEVVETILQIAGSKAEARWGIFTAPLHDQYPWVADMDHTFKHFTWRPRTSFEDGIRNMIAAMSGASTP